MLLMEVAIPPTKEPFLLTFPSRFLSQEASKCIECLEFSISCRLLWICPDLSHVVYSLVGMTPCMIAGAMHTDAHGERARQTSCVTAIRNLPQMRDFEGTWLESSKMLRELECFRKNPSDGNWKKLMKPT